MSKQKFLFWLKIMILLSPLPFGCAGRIGSPLFYFLLAGITALAMKNIRDRITILYEDKIRLLMLLFFGFLFFQLIPLPRFILKILSPSTLKVLDDFALEPFRFHSLSLVPADTLVFGMGLLALVLFFYVFIHLELKKPEIFSLINVLIASAFIQAAFGIIKWLLKTNKYFLFFHKMENPVRMVSGTFFHQDHFSFFLEMVFPLVIGMILIKTYFPDPWATPAELSWKNLLKNKWLAFYFISVFFWGIGIWLCKSLTGRMALFLAIVILATGFLFFRMKDIHISPQTLRWIIFIIVFLSFFYALRNNLERANRPDKDGNIRSEIWKDSGKVFLRFPISGAGYGNFQHISYLCQNKKDEIQLKHASNEYLEHLVEGGIIGAGLFFSALGLLLFSLFRMWLTRHHPQVKMLGMALLVGIALAVFHGFFTSSFRIPANGFLFTLVLGLTLKLILYQRGSRDEA